MPIRDPVAHKEYNRQWYIRNKERHYAMSRVWRAAHKDYYRTHQRDYQYKRLYGITLADYDAMLAAQQGACAICHRTDPGGKTDLFHVDHDHVTGRVRGLLCNRCNRCLGWTEKHWTAAVAYMSPK